ncbi:uncharacterized protein LOC128954775 [Oppia nitens]|uniref:uncharacterized protein LOC128954775 n=1 Tax=Oppia nitens TaxID=1686743 RepID=UPI0023DA9BDF|nr:uncharacterized protein LOC128954775 [Oppia nitens]
MDNETGRKIALAGALMAGIAYFGISILRDVFSSGGGNSNRVDNNHHKKSRKRRKSDVTDSRHTADNALTVTSCFGHSLSNASSQTDLTLPIGQRERTAAFRNIPPELWSPWAKSIEERIRELNIRLVNTTNFQFRRSFGGSNHLTPNRQYRSCGNTPKRNLSGSASPDPSLGTLNESTDRLYRSVSDNLDVVVTDRNTNIGIKRAVNISVPSDTEIQMNKKKLDKLFGKSQPNLSQQDAKGLTILLMSRDEDLIIKTLSVIANCCAFSVNIDTICDSGCVLLLYELLSDRSRAVQTATINAVANVANSERAQELLRECIPLLISHVKTSDNDLLTNWTLRALANLALKDYNQILMVSAIDKYLCLLSHPNTSLRLQSSKLLVNLSSNSEMVPYLLAAKAPTNLYALLDSSHDMELVLRVTNFLANIIDITCLRELTPRDLPVEYKASSPETLYSAIYGFEATELLLKRLNDLVRVPHEDVVFQVKRILKKVR